MKKSDLTRRAANNAKAVYERAALYLPSEQEAHATGFEADYLAARADLRRVVKACQTTKSREANWSAFVGSVWVWLRPIR